MRGSLRLRKKKMKKLLAMAAASVRRYYEWEAALVSAISFTGGRTGVRRRL